ncbi:hypothetical protein EMIT07CA2_10622 [Brevibacillus sp. IT-7CA2]
MSQHCLESREKVKTRPVAFAENHPGVQYPKAQKNLDGEIGE